MSLRRHGKRKRNNRRNEQLRKLKKLKAANTLARKRAVTKVERAYAAGATVLRAILTGAVQPKEVGK